MEPLLPYVALCQSQPQGHKVTYCENITLLIWTKTHHNILTEKHTTYLNWRFRLSLSLVIFTEHVEFGFSEAPIDPRWMIPCEDKSLPITNSWSQCWRSLTTKEVAHRTVLLRLNGESNTYLNELKIFDKRIDGPKQKPPRYRCQHNVDCSYNTHPIWQKLQLQIWLCPGPLAS